MRLGVYVPDGYSHAVQQTGKLVLWRKCSLCPNVNFIPKSIQYYAVNGFCWPTSTFRRSWTDYCHSVKLYSLQHPILRLYNPFPLICISVVEVSFTSIIPYVYFPVVEERVRHPWNGWIITRKILLHWLAIFTRYHLFVSQELKNESDIPEKDLLRALQSLAMGKQSQRILSKEPKSKEIGELCEIAESWWDGCLFVSWLII